MASDSADTLEDRQQESYVDTAHLSSAEITLSGTPGTVTSITVPNPAKGFKLYPRTNAIRFNVNAGPAAVGASNSTTVDSSAFGAGGIAKNDVWETRLLPSSPARTLRLSSVTASVVVDVEFF